MNDRRALDILKHITQDKDYGVGMMQNISVSESIHVLTQLLPSCIEEATEKNKENDIGYFSQIIRTYRPIVLDKIKNAERLWVVYSDITGYPYEIDGDMLVLYDYAHHKDIEIRLAGSGFKPALLDVDAQHFKNEISHMYRNGFKNIRFVDGKSDNFVVAREELYGHEEFFNEDYITNPAMQISMISYFQELRKEVGQIGREELLKTREDRMIYNVCNAEFMVPCTKTETEEEVEISHPYIDLTGNVPSEDGSQVIAIPAFSDGFEMQKCYEGHNENMLYTFKELRELVAELGASGAVINCLGISYYISEDMMEKFLNKL